jgi:prepilin-type N-terminal cleavage/methylation domain-containing protein
MTGTAVRPGQGQAGFTLIDLLFVIAIISLLSTLAVPGLMRARGAAHSASAVATLRVVNSAQLSYAITCGVGFYAPDLPALGVTPAGAPDAYLPPELAAAPTFIKSGYNFSMAGTSLPGAPPTCNGLAAGRAAPGYAVVADELGATIGSGRFFGSNADGVIYEHVSSLAPSMPESGLPALGVPLH